MQKRSLGWETWSEEDVARRGLVHWKTVTSAGVTQSEQLTMGIASIPPGEALHEHRHRQAEIYLVLEGNAMVRVGSVARPIEAEARAEGRPTPYLLRLDRGAYR